jgi:uncharacterized cupin superfamily protein
MIIRKDQVQSDQGNEGRAERRGPFELLRYSETGGLTQFGAYVETLQPGSSSSDRHWHEEEDEFLYVLAGEATVIEDDGAHALLPGDAACAMSFTTPIPERSCTTNRTDGAWFAATELY